MRKPLPSRSLVLELLKNENRSLEAREIGDHFDVPPANLPGLLRLLDALVYEGLLSARGEQFRFGEPVIADSGAASKHGRATSHTRPSVRPSRHEKKSEKPARIFDADRKRKKRDGLETVPVIASARPQRETTRPQREGVLRMNPRGFGFIASPDSTGDDIYVSPDNIAGAMHGDHVLVDIISRTSRGLEGRITAVKTRGTPRASGILRRRGKSAWVELDDPRIKGPVVLTRDIDTQSAEGEGNSGRDGQVVVVQITRFPESSVENPEGKIVAVLGNPGELSVETRKVLLIHGATEVHSEAAITEAERYGDEVPEAMLQGREDLTHVPLPTIDPDDARDHDDAVWVQRRDDGGYEVWVAIADVSAYVRPGTAIDDEARARGCSIYLPDRAIPMLPRALSSNLCSLLPDVTRLCLCVHAVLDVRANVQSARVVRGFMKSAAKLTYGGVAKALGLTTEPAKNNDAEAFVEDLRVAAECALLLRAKRMKRGALDFDLPEAVIKLDQDGQPTEVRKRSGDPGIKKAYQIIEELMLFANETVAKWLLSRDLPAIYRIHLPPDPKKLERLSAMCELLGIEFDVESTQTPKDLARLLRQFATHPRAAVLNQLLLRSMKQATYDVSNEGHFGLASDAYLHFTSPIRRYPDLVDHRIIHAALDHEQASAKSPMRRVADPEKMAEAAIQSSMAERRAMEIEREIVDIYRCFYMIDRIGERFEGTISAFVGTGAFVTIDDPFVDVLVRTEDLGADFEISEDGLAATSSRTGQILALGDAIIVDITDCAILRRTIYARRVYSASAEDSVRHTRASKQHGKKAKSLDRSASEGRAQRFGRDDGDRGAKRGLRPSRGGKAPARAEKAASPTTVTDRALAKKRGPKNVKNGRKPTATSKSGGVVKKVKKTKRR